MNTIQKVAVVAAMMMSNSFGAVEVPTVRNSPPFRFEDRQLPRKERSNWAKSIGKRERKLAERKRQRQARRRQRRK